MSHELVIVLAVMTLIAANLAARPERRTVSRTRASERTGSRAIRYAHTGDHA